ncbi:MAG TPA: ribosome maturation factor RimM [Cerasibacillus sp.]|uniref:ribosome maturation factor RimM n=1 Tax=Cerasibacillus sp. TaxID=2498711 RepID=UPI002F426A7A
MDKQFFVVGEIINTHGIKGELKVVKISDKDNRFNPGTQLYLYPKESPVLEVTIEQQRLHRNYHLLKFAGFNHISEVEPFKGGLLKISADQMEELEEGAYYYHDIIGCDVFTLTQEKIGSVTDIIATGANDVWVVKGTNQREILIPYIDDVVKTVNITEKKIEIDPMEGLLE